jgi:hypothetical protein
MKTFAAFRLLGIALLWSTTARAAEFSTLYEPALLTNTRYPLRSEQMYKAISAGLLNDDERQRLSGTTLAFPPIADVPMYRGSQLAFYSFSPPATVTMPILSLKFLEDVCIASAWLQKNGYTQQTVADYAAMLHYGKAPSYPPPLKALGVPDSALLDPAVDKLSLSLFNDSRAFILLHELGHLYNRDSANPPNTAAESQAHEVRADGFALDVMRRDGEIPVGVVVFFTVATHLEPCRADYASDEQWRQHLISGSHPLTANRITAIAASLKLNSSDFARNEDDVAAGTLKVQAIAAMIDMFASDLKDPDNQRMIRIVGERTTPASLTPRRPGESSLWPPQK